MLALTGRKADGWIPSLAYLQPGDLEAGNARIDAAARDAGREPAAIRRLLNLGGTFAPTARGPLEGPPAHWADELTRLALEDGISSFILASDDAGTVQTFAAEVAPEVRERVAAARARGAEGSAASAPASPVPQAAATTPEAEHAAAPGEASEYERLGVQPTPDDGARRSATRPWDEATRPRRQPSPPDVTYSRRGRLVGQHLIDVHDMLRRELDELHGVLGQVREGALTAAQARSALNEMALRQNDWTLGAFCARYCGAVAQHHGLEDDAIFPHLVASEPTLEPVIERLTDEHLVIHDAIHAVDRALVQHMHHSDDYEPIEAALDFLSDALLSHLSYEEWEIVEPLSRLGFYPGQV
jgi:hypothetical protein